MCVCEWNLPNMEAAPVGKGYTTHHAQNSIEFYLDTHSECHYQHLTNQLKISFELAENYSSLIGNFHSNFQRNKETEDQFVNELQILGWKVISIKPNWKKDLIGAFQSQLSDFLWNQYYSAEACN